MALHLSIENVSSLPDGGPLSVIVPNDSGLEIGRDAHLDWTLPDPTRTISGKHCEIRFHDGGYWLHDMSSNGTFVNGSDHRIQSAHRLGHGDRVEIGHYIIAVAIDTDEVALGQVIKAAERPNGADLWNVAGDLQPEPHVRGEAPPPRESQPAYPDFLDWAIDPPTQSPARQPEQFGEEPAWVRPADTISSLARQNAPESGAPRMPVPMSPGWRSSGGVSTIPGPDEAAPNGRAPVQLSGSFPSKAPAHGASAEPAATAKAPGPGPGPVASTDAEMLRRFAHGAGIPEEVIAWRDPGDFAELLGGLMRLIVADLKSLLTARAESRRMARSTNQTMIQALDNNPLKFSPNTEDALRLIFGRPASGYLGAQGTFEQSFKDLRVHQIKTYAAMQHALRMLVEDLDPKAIDEATSLDSGWAALAGSRKSKLWDSYVTRWRAKTAPHEDGLVDAFMIYFAECYDQVEKRK